MLTLFEKIKYNGLYKIRYQIMLLLFFAIFLPIMCIQFFNFSKTTDLFLRKNQAILDDNLQLSQNNINNILGDYRNILLQMATDGNCMDSILQLSKVSTDSAEYRRICDSLDTYIRANVLMYPEIQAIGVVSLTGTPYLYVQERENTQNTIDYFHTEKELLHEKLLNSASPIIDSIPVDNSNYDVQSPVFYLGSRTIHFEKMKVSGSIIIFISTSKLNQALNNPQSKVYDFTNKLLVDSNGQILCSKNPGQEEYQTMDWAKMQTRSSRMQGDYLISVSALEHFQLNLLSLTNYHDMNQDLGVLWKAIIIIMVAVMCSALLIAYIFGRKLIVPIENIAAKMNSFDRNHLDIKVTPTSKNEVRIIETSFNQMLEEIQLLLSENQKQFKQICQAELTSLELQINPHFLFNTIDSINWMAVQENCTDVSEQLNRLANILRHTVYHMNSVVPLKAEINWMVDYLELQKHRYKNRFRYEIRDCTRGHQIHIHKLLLQPFLENALLHGFENIDYPGMLIISCRIIRDFYLLLEVSDNGQGLAAGKVKQINELFSTGKNVLHGVGLANIAYRTRGYYPGSHIYVSASRYGTCFKFFIPLNEMEDSDVSIADC